MFKKILFLLVLILPLSIVAQDKCTGWATQNGGVTAKDVGQGNSFTIPYEYKSAMNPGKDVKKVVMEGCGPFGKAGPVVVIYNENSVKRQKAKNLIHSPAIENTYSILGTVLSEQIALQPVIREVNKKSTIQLHIHRQP